MNKYPVRISIKAIIIEDECLLCMKHMVTDGVYYILPGGGQEFGETVFEAVIRECAEEACISVHPKEMLFIRDYIGKNHEFADTSADFHQVEIMVRCSITGGIETKTGSNPDTNQIGVEWIALKELANAPFYPKILKSKIGEMHGAGGKNRGGTYIGDVN